MDALCKNAHGHVLKAPYIREICNPKNKYQRFNLIRVYNIESMMNHFAETEYNKNNEPLILHICSSMGYLDTFSKIYEKSDRRNATYSYLGVACLRGRSNIIKWFVQNNQAAINDYVSTCVYRAICNDHIEVVKLMLPYFNSYYDNFIDIVIVAKYKGFHDMAETLLGRIDNVHFGKYTKYESANYFTVDILQWLRTTIGQKNVRVCWNVLYSVLLNGKTQNPNRAKCIMWFHENVNDEIDAVYDYWYLSDDLLDVAKYLYEHNEFYRIETRVKELIKASVYNEQFKIASWLISLLSNDK